MFSRKWLGILVVLGVLLAACGDDDDKPGGDAAASFVETVQASIKAENAGDAEAFLALWTDDGLESYDSGTREEISAGEGHFSEEDIKVTRMGEPKVDGDVASVELDATVGKPSFATTVFRVVFSGIRDGDGWKINKFDFRGSPPPGDDAEVVEITAREYSFHLDRDTVPAGEVAFHFVNEGQEQHEISLYKGPDGVTLDAAKAALENVDGSELSDIPEGYEVSHVAFAEQGDESDVTFAEPLAAGTYVLACYIPEGGFGDDGPVRPDGTPHIKLGMVHLLTLK